MFWVLRPSRLRGAARPSAGRTMTAVREAEGRLKKAKAQCYYCRRGHVGPVRVPGPCDVRAIWFHSAGLPVLARAHAELCIDHRVPLYETLTKVHHDIMQAQLWRETQPPPQCLNEISFRLTRNIAGGKVRWQRRSSSKRLLPIYFSLLPFLS